MFIPFKRSSITDLFGFQGLSNVLQKKLYNAFVNEVFG